MIGRISAFLFGVIAYAAFFASLVFFMGWIAGFGVPVALDGPATGSVGVAIAADLGLMLVLALQHSVMARPKFKAWWTRIVPQSIERSTYVLLSSIALLAMMIFWQPLGGVVWSVDHSIGKWAIRGVFALGWVVLFVSTFLINHFDLFGLRQVWLKLVDRHYTQLPFGTPFLYRWVRHPLYVGWIMIFWAAPTISIAHLLLATALTTYILVAIQFEERDLIKSHSEYAQYREEVPMLVPRLGG
jgi:protein-S-isoprenylcysteine O-methyltransferase Ste14